MSESKNPEYINRLSQQIRRLNAKKPNSALEPCNTGETTNIVRHPVLTEIMATDDPVVAITQLTRQQRDLHIDLQQTNRVNSKLHTQAEGRLTALEDHTQSLDDQLEIVDQNMRLVAGEIDTLRAESQQLQAAQELLAQQQTALARQLNEHSATLTQLAKRRFTTTQLIITIGFIGIFLLMIVGLIRNTGRFASIRKDIDVLYENDTILQRQYQGGGVQP
ncbi:MAG: hypothetical protein AAF959_01090 [Cyanobacteria bacterium P01_D01_bin.56]